MHFAHIALSLIAIGSTTQEGVAWLSSKSKESGVVATGSGPLYANAQNYNLISVLNMILCRYRVVREGAAGAARPSINSPCDCHYRGTLIDGREFDSSYARGAPATFAPSEVIQGWCEALLMMKEGDV